MRPFGRGWIKGYNYNYLIIALLLSHKPAFTPKGVRAPGSWPDRCRAGVLSTDATVQGVPEMRYIGREQVWG